MRHLEKQMEYLKEVSPNVYKLFLTLGIREVDYGFGWVIIGQAGTKTLPDVFAYIYEKMEKLKAR